MAAEEQANAAALCLQAPVDQRGNGRLPCSQKEVGVRRGEQRAWLGPRAGWGRGVRWRMGPDAPEKRNAGVRHPVLSNALTLRSLFYGPSSLLLQFSSSDYHVRPT